MNKINILIILIILFLVFKCSCNTKENFTKENNFSICRKKHLDAYKNCILSDFDMYTSQSPSRDWNKKWDQYCKDTKDYKCELLKDKSKNECKKMNDDDFIREFEKLNKKNIYKNKCLKKPTLLYNPKIIKNINTIDTKVIDTEENINDNGFPNKNKLKKLYDIVIKEIKNEIDDIDKSIADKN